MRSPIIEETKTQLNQYFARKRESFDISLYLVETEFQKGIWNALIQIAFGKTQRYLGLSKSLNNKKEIRSIARANGANAISILIPCHRNNW